MHSMRTSILKKEMMAIKVDLEKAYDRVSWAFLQDTLVLAGFPMDLVRILMYRVTTTKMSVLWNGEVIDQFTPMRGLRQGDPLSPYLFVLYMERPAHIIRDAVSTGD